MLHRYSGERILEHFGATPGTHSSSTYGQDKTGSALYRFNRLGFRCMDDREAADIYACGCSYTFGEGLNYEQTWPYLFAESYARWANRPNADVANFSQGGASNAYIARTLVCQSAAVRPRLVLALFSHLGRTEYYVSREQRNLLASSLGTRPSCEHIGTMTVLPKYSLPWYKQKLALRTLPVAFRPLGAKLLAWTRHYYEGTYSDLRATVDAMTHILSVQHFCQSRGIEYLMSWVDHGRLLDGAIREHPALSPLVELLDRDRFVDFSLIDADLWVDRAADGRHPGPRSHELFAARLWRAFEAVASSSRSSWAAR